MGIELKVQEVVDQAKAQGISPAELRLYIRRREEDVEAEGEVEAVAKLVPKLPPEKWQRLRAYLMEPVIGEARLGRTERGIAAGLKEDDQEAFWLAALPGLKDIRRQVATGQRLIGEDHDT